jgi:WD40 repeat protein
MKKNRILFAIVIAALVTCIAGCVTYGTRYGTKYLDKNQIANARTALVIDTEFFGSLDEPYNSFNLKCEYEMTKDECNEIITRLKHKEGTQRANLMASLATMTFDALDQKGLPVLGLDKKTFFDSKQFPMEYPGDRRTYCAVSRNYSGLAQQGYTHVLYMGFPNRVAYKKDTQPALFFGVEAFMLDIRPTSGDMNSAENRLQRQAWCYKISPTQQSQTYSETHDTGLAAPPGQKIQMTYTTTTYTRDCLGIALIRRNGTPYTLDGLFTGSAPVYFELYKRAALYNLNFASKHLAGGKVYDSDVKKGVEAEVFISEEFIPTHKIKDLSKLTVASNSGKVHSVAFSPDGRTIASGSYHGFVQLSDVTSGKQMRFFHASHSKYGSVDSVAFSPDGKIIASADTDKRFELWDAATGKLIADFTGHSSAVSSLAFSPDGRTIASGSWDKSVKLWDAASRNLIATFTGHLKDVVSVAFSPDGKTIASGSRDKSIKLWDVSSGKLTATLTGHSEDVVSVAFSSDSRTIVSGSLDGFIKLWDVTSGKIVATLGGHSDRVRSVAFSPDGKTIASGSNDRTVKLWYAASRQLIATFTGHSEQIVSVAFSPDGKTIASGSNDESVKLWDAAKAFRVKY